MHQCLSSQITNQNLAIEGDLWNFCDVKSEY